MKGSMRVEGAREFAGLAGRMAATLGRSRDSILRQEARELCIELGAATMPGPGFGEGKAAAFRRRVDAEVKRVFPSREDGYFLVGLLARRSRRLAAGLRRVMKENPGGWERDPQALRYLKEGGVRVEALSPAVHKAARTGRKGSVPKNYRATGVVSGPQQRAFSRKQQEKVGLAKAGWYAAARSGAGRVRRSTVVDGKRRSVQVFPGWVRKLDRKFPGLGGAEISEGRVVVFSAVRHAEEAIPEHLFDAAVDKARLALRRALAESVRRVRGRGVGVAAA